MAETPVAIIGAGISGIAAAQQLTAFDTHVIDRGRRIGGRLAVRTVRDTGTRWDGRPVDLGASYFTTTSPEFTAQALDWERAGVARQWTRTLQVADADGITGETTGPMRWSAPRGLRSIVEHMAIGLPSIEQSRTVSSVRVTEDLVSVDDRRVRAALLCMPEPQAARILRDERAGAPAACSTDAPWEPVLALVSVYPERIWPEITGVFVNGAEVLGFIADDGSRRGDGAAVLVSHATPAFSALHLEDPAKAGPAMVAATRRVLGIAGDPVDIHVHRWTFARPVSAQGDAHYWDGRIGRAGDAWHGGPRVEAAWLSGRSLGERVAGTL